MSEVWDNYHGVEELWECDKWSWEQIGVAEPGVDSFEWDFEGEGGAECWF